MKHRLFVALPISEKLQQEILEWEKKYQDLPVRWLAGKNLHITLVPPWYVESQAQTDADSPREIASHLTGQARTNVELGKVKAALQKVAGFGEFEIKFSKVAFGPEPRRPRLIWAEGETPKELIELQQRLCVIFGKEPEKRPFRIHLTIARFRPETFPSFPVEKLDEKVDWRDRAERVVLFESILSRGGADYEIISETLLNI